MSWKDKVNETFLINLPHRTDRLMDFIEMSRPYDFEFTIVDAIANEQAPATGLRDTMVKLFKECLDKGYECIQVFEDDALIIDPTFNETISNALNQAPTDFDIIYGGCQPTCGYRDGFYSHNLLRVYKGFATHHCIYSRKCMEYLVSQSWEAPIDTWIVNHLQEMGKCFATHPFLTTQAESYSDIGKQVWTWRPFLEIRHQQRILELKQRGINQPPI